MMRTMTILGAGLIGLMHPTAAHAGPLDFMFSFSNTFGNVSGTVTGEIFGLTDNTTGQAATNVVVDRYPTGLGLPTPPLTVFSNPSVNSFTVVDDAITAANYSADDASGEANLTLNFNSQNALFSLATGNFLLNAGGFAGATYTPVAVPAPLLATGPIAGSVTLLATGLATLWPLRRRLRRRAASA